PSPLSERANTLDRGGLNQTYFFSPERTFTSGASTWKNSNSLTCRTPEPVAASACKYILSAGAIRLGLSGNLNGIVSNSRSQTTPGISSSVVGAFDSHSM